MRTQRNKGYGIKKMIVGVGITLYSMFSIVFVGSNLTLAQVKFESKYQDMEKDILEENSINISVSDDLNDLEIEAILASASNLNMEADQIILEQSRLQYKYNDIPLIIELKNYILQESEKYGVDPDVMFGIYFYESRFDTNAANPRSSARGLGQILRGTGSEIYPKIYGGTYNHDYAYDPEINITMTCYYMGYLLDKYNGNYKLALNSYGDGSSNYYSHILDYSQQLKAREDNFLVTVN